MDKLIITCGINDATSWKGVKGLHVPVTVQEVADSVRAARDAGAAVVNINEPLLTKRGKDTRGYNGKAWLEVSKLIRQGSDVIFEHGQDGFPYFSCKHREPPVPAELQQQTFDLGAEKPDMISTMLTQVDYEIGPSYYYMPTRGEISQFMQLCRQNGVKPSFQVWHHGSYFELGWLVDNKLVEPPYWLTLFFGSNSGTGSWATTKEFFHRMKYLPEKSLWQVSVLSGVKGIATTQEQLNLLTMAINLGGHVRVGMADSPYYWDGVPAESNAQLVERIVRIARDLGREIATPAESRQMLRLPRRK